MENLFEGKKIKHAECELDSSLSLFVFFRRVTDRPLLSQHGAKVAYIVQQWRICETKAQGHVFTASLWSQWYRQTADITHS